MSKFDLKMKKVADTKIAKFGAAVKVTRNGATVGSGYGIFTKARTTIDGSGQQFQTAITVKSMTLTALAKTPEVGDIITFQKETYTVQAVEVIRPSDTSIAYKVEVAYG